MGLLHPGQLIWLALAVLVLLLYLAGRRRGIDVSSHLLWRRTLARQSAWRRWQRPVSAAILAALLALCAVALAEPYWRSERDAARTIVLVLGQAGGGELADGTAKIRSAALSQVDEMWRYERMAILGTAGAPHVLCPLTDDRVKLRKAIESWPAAGGPQAIAEAEDLARWMIAAQQNPTIVVLAVPSEIKDCSTEKHRPGAPPGAWLLGAALVLCGSEWILFSRRITV